MVLRSHQSSTQSSLKCNIREQKTGNISVYLGKRICRFVMTFIEMFTGSFLVNFMAVVEGNFVLECC